VVSEKETRLLEYHNRTHRNWEQNLNTFVIMRGVISLPSQSKKQGEKKMIEIERTANNMAIEIMGERNQKKRGDLYYKLVAHTTPLWDGVLCSEYGSTVWGQLFISEMRYDEEWETLPWKYRKFGFSLTAKSLPFFCFNKSGRHHPDGSPILLLRATSAIIDELKKTIRR
jgi:hypothetical protein